MFPSSIMKARYIGKTLFDRQKTSKHFLFFQLDAWYKHEETKDLKTVKIKQKTC
jgi:hypothetical protein